VVGEIERVLEALNEAEVRYLVVGGVAVVLHGHLRTTADLDLVVSLDPENARRAVQALEELGYSPRAPVPAAGFAEPATRTAWIRDKGLTVFSLWSPQAPSLEVDLFVDEPFDFDDAYGRALRVPLQSTHATVIARDDLIAMKRALGRPLDQEDAIALEELGEGDG
jgi:hypothetical protein